MADALGTSTGIARIEAAFANARQEDRAALMPYMMGCFPDPDGALEVARAYADGGADLVEVGIPFSDPLADGPVIHAAATQALARGADLDRSLAACEALGEGVPAVVMCYVNMVLALGPRRFAGRLAEAGAAGAIVPDLPPEESAEVSEALGAEGMALVPMVAPTTPPERRRRICESARGFVYVVSVAGVTGERDEIPDHLARLVGDVQAEAAVPAAVGFGIGTAEQAAAVGRIADGVIIGTRMVREVGQAADASRGAEGAAELLRELRAALAG